MLTVYYMSDLGIVRTRSCLVLVNIMFDQFLVMKHLNFILGNEFSRLCLEPRERNRKERNNFPLSLFGSSFGEEKQLKIYFLSHFEIFFLHSSLFLLQSNKKKYLLPHFHLPAKTNKNK